MKRSIFYRLNRHNSNFKVAVKAIIFVMIACILLFCTTGYARNLTFLVTSDLHYNYEPGEVSNPAQITAMNNLPGKLYPEEIGGTVDTPSFVLVSGDMSDRGTYAGWFGPTGFLAQYGLNGTDGMLHYPVYEGQGNNDVLHDFIKNSIISRHGNIYYSFDADGVHVVCLDDYPTLEILNWLNSDLASMSDPCMPVVLFHHRPFTDSALDANRQYYMSIIGNYKILALFYGHLHDSSHTLYDDPYSDAVYDTFLTDTPTRHSSPNYFYVVHITDDTMTVVENNWSECDLYKDGKTDFLDFAVFAEQWMQIDCGPCGGADFTGDGNVDANDLKKLADKWLDSRIICRNIVTIPIE